MRKLRISPAHLADLMEHGYEENGDSSALNFGSAVHCRVLEPGMFDRRYAIRPDGLDGRSKAGKDFAAEAKAAGRVVLSAEHGRWCDAMAFRAKTNYRVREWLARPHDTEVSLVWERDGFLCKARADLTVSTLNTICDVKTTITASQQGFARQVAKYGYHEQGAWYMDGMRRLTGKTWDFYFIACEKARPFLVTCHQLVRDSPAHLRAVAENDRLFELYKQCCKARQWPGYGDIFEIELPEWALVDDSDETGNVPEQCEDEPF
jgi:exodeoxyribonuclease VIII